MASSLNLAVFFSVLAVVCCWTKVRDERMPDDDHWFFTNKHFIYKTTVSPIQIVQANYEAIPEELRKERFDHIGDIDVLDGVIYGGIENDDGKGIIAAWNASDLSIIRYTLTQQKKMPWIAVDPDTKLLYSAVWNDCCNLQIYDMDFQFVRTLRVGNDSTPMPREIQGAAFYQGDLYVSTNGNDTVWKINVNTGEYSFVLTDLYDHHEYEMEGLDFWDLRSKGLGVMHMYGNFMQAIEKCIRNYDP